MDIEFRSVSGSRVGFIIGNDIKDTNGNRVGMIVGNDIKDSYGNRVGILNGSDIKDISGNRVGMIIGNDIKDTYGNRVGYPISGASQLEMAAAGLLLFNLKHEVATGSPSSSNLSDSSINYPKYENNTVNDGSYENELIKIDGQYYPKKAYQAVQESLSIFSPDFLEEVARERDIRNIEREIKQRQEAELQNFKNWQNKQPGKKGTLEEYTKAKEEKLAKKEARKKAWKKQRKFVGPMLTFVPFFVGLVLYYIACNENRWYLGDTIGRLIGCLICLGIPIIIIHFRNWFSVLPIISTIIFIIAILYFTLSSNGFNLFWKGSLAMIVSFIMACAYSKKDYRY